MKTSDEIKRILTSYNISEKEKSKLGKELQEYIDKRIKEIAEQQRIQFSEKMKKLAREELLKMIESKKEKKIV
jgi:hypothetical protein